ncbi:hypothetical protein HYX01_00075 [Candidatus Woesearchaeota archaeon]|nr:hypothetical protein [Candidatus Woesearchaeota archaeon]
MGIVYVQTQDGTPLQLIRDRTLEEYCKHFRHQGDDLVTILLKLAQVKDTVAFYDIGCGEGCVAKSLHENLKERAERLGLDGDLANKVTYIGMDLECGNYWVASDKKKFYRGDILDILKENSAQLPPIDLGVSLFVFPYISRKLETLEALIKMLNRGDGLGILLIEPFNNHQLVFLDGSEERPLTVAESLSGGFEIIYPNGSELRLVAKRGETTPLNVNLAKTECDFWQFSKGGLIGYPGQKISYYQRV